MKILDLFCCCGGVSMGLSDGGKNTVVGVDITGGHNYPFEFIQSDVFDLDENFFKEFDFIWASPPCQQFSYGSKRWLNAGYDMSPNLIPQTRELLEKAGKPFVIENTPNAPLKKDLLLCGEMFGLRVVRHRIFEFGNIPSSIRPPSKHPKHRKPIDKTHSYYACVAGHGGNGYSFRLEDWQNTMGIDWVNDKKHLTQMIPPAYSNYIIRHIYL